MRIVSLLKYNELYRRSMLCSHSLCLGVQYFRGNRDRNTIVMHILKPRIEARVIRIHPVRWVNHISMRVEFYGRAAGRFTNLNLTSFAASVPYLCCCCCCCCSVLILILSYGGKRPFKSFRFLVWCSKYRASFEQNYVDVHK